MFTRKDLNIITKWINTNIDKDIKVKKSSRFECDTDEEIIYLANKQFTKEHKYFYEWFKTQPFYTPINHTLVCILHEIGHIMTKDDDLLEESYWTNELYTMLYNSKSITEKEFQMAYFNMESERLATEWGIQYYLNHKQECDNISKLIGLHD